MKLFQDHYRQRILSLLKDRKLFLFDKSLDLVNLAGAALIFGQLLQLENFNPYTFTLGLLIVVAFYAAAWYNFYTF